VRCAVRELAIRDLAYPRVVQLLGEKTGIEAFACARHFTTSTSDELTVIFDLAFVPLKSFAIVSDFAIARLP